MGVVYIASDSITYDYNIGKYLDPPYSSSHQEQVRNYYSLHHQRSIMQERCTMKNCVFKQDKLGMSCAKLKLS